MFNAPFFAATSACCPKLEVLAVSKACEQAKPPQLPPLYRVWDRPVRYVTMPDLQYDSRTSVAGMSTIRHPQASVLASRDYGEEEAFRQPRGPATHGRLHAGNLFVSLLNV